MKERKKAVVIDDEFVNVELITQMISLIRQELTSFGAFDGTNGIEIIDKWNQEVALIITDIDMSPISGLEVIGHVRKNYPEIKVIAMSGDIRWEDRVKKEGADIFLAKPFNMKKLEEAINEVI